MFILQYPKSSPSITRIPFFKLWQTIPYSSVTTSSIYYLFQISLFLPFGKKRYHRIRFFISDLSHWEDTHIVTTFISGESLIDILYLTPHVNRMEGKFRYHWNILSIMSTPLTSRPSKFLKRHPHRRVIIKLKVGFKLTQWYTVSKSVWCFFVIGNNTYL